MKKLLILVLATLLCLTVVLFSACDKEKDPVADASVSQSKEESVTSSSQITSRKPRPSTSQSNNSITSGGDNSDDSTGSDKPQPSGDSYTVPNTPTEGLSETVAAVVKAINNIGTVNDMNYQQKSQVIQLAENRYTALTDQEKAQVPNYKDLQGARAAYDKFVLSVATQYIDSFKASVLLISDFSDDVGFKDLVDDADEKYNAIDQAYKNKVSAEYEILVVAKLHAEVNLIPSAENITGEYYIPIQNLKKNYHALTAAQKNAHKKFAQDNQKLEDCMNKIMSNMIERAYIVQDSKSVSDPKPKDGVTKPDGIIDTYEENNPKKRYDSGDGFFSTTGANSNAAGNGVYYQDSKNPNPVKLQSIVKGDITFNAPKSGILTIYVSTSKPMDYKVLVNDQVIDIITVPQDSGNNEDYVLNFEIPSAGAVTITAVKTGKDTKTDGYIHAVKFVYSNI